MISPQSTEKLEKINSLTKIIADAEKELDVILGGETVAEAKKKFSAKKEPSGAASKAKKRCCKKCGKPGHRSDNCPDSKPKGFETAWDKKDIEQDDDQEDDMPVEKDLVSEPAYDGVKKLKDMEYLSKEAAEESGFHIATINKIYSSPTWEYFMKNFPHLVKND